jgi:hypothetical protein
VRVPLAAVADGVRPTKKKICVGMRHGSEVEFVYSHDVSSTKFQVILEESMILVGMWCVGDVSQCVLFFVAVSAQKVVQPWLHCIALWQKGQDVESWVGQALCRPHLQIFGQVK